MIFRAYITAWKQMAPWISDARVEQDLAISRALLEILTDSLLGRTVSPFAVVLHYTSSSLHLFRAISKILIWFKSILCPSARSLTACVNGFRFYMDRKSHRKIVTPH